MSAPLTKKDHTLPVSAIKVTVHTTGLFFESDMRSGNHASIFLLTGDECSICLNMIKAEATDTMGTYILERYSYESSTSSVYNKTPGAVSGLTVGKVIRLVEDKDGPSTGWLLVEWDVDTGCESPSIATVYSIFTNIANRWTVIEDPRLAGYITSSGAATAQNDLQYNYSMGQAPEYEAIMPGSFV